MTSLLLFFMTLNLPLLPFKTERMSCLQFQDCALAKNIKIHFIRKSVLRNGHAFQIRFFFSPPERNTNEMQTKIGRKDNANLSQNKDMSQHT